jgi:hypothetical protein
MEAGTGKAKSGKEYEGLNEEQVHFLNYLTEQLKGKDTGGLRLEVMPACWKWDPNRHMFVQC